MFNLTCSEIFEQIRNRTSQKSSVLLIIYWLIIEFDYLNEGDKLLKLLYSAGPRLSKQILYFLSNQESAQSKIPTHENVPMTSWDIVTRETLWHMGQRVIRLMLHIWWSSGTIFTMLNLRKRLLKLRSEIIKFKWWSWFTRLTISGRKLENLRKKIQQFLKSSTFMSSIFEVIYWQ